MNMYNLNSIKDYFGDRLKNYRQEEFDLKIVSQLSETNREILFNVGLPVYNGLGGKYEPILTPSLLKDKYLSLYTINGKPWNNVSLDLETNMLMYLNDIYGSMLTSRKYNKNLKIHLEYILEFENFHKKIISKEVFGPYDYENNHEKYSEVLKNQFKTISNDYEEGTWFVLLLEMKEGII
ncbi:MAG: hypothetical protein ACO1PI_10415 [Bacteroidota bacterium]